MEISRKGSNTADWLEIIPIKQKTLIRDSRSRGGVLLVLRYTLTPAMNMKRRSGNIYLVLFVLLGRPLSVGLARGGVPSIPPVTLKNSALSE